MQFMWESSRNIAHATTRTTQETGTMKATVNFSQFTDAFNAIRPDNFTYAGLRALYDYIEGYEEDCETEIELDVIALCCEYSEYEDIAEYNTAYDTEHETREDIDETTMIPVGTEGLIIQDY